MFAVCVVSSRPAFVELLLQVLCSASTAVHLALCLAQHPPHIYDLTPAMASTLKSGKRSPLQVCLRLEQVRIKVQILHAAADHEAQSPVMD